MKRLTWRQSIVAYMWRRSIYGNPPCLHRLPPPSLTSTLFCLSMNITTYVPLNPTVPLSISLPYYATAATTPSVLPSDPTPFSISSYIAEYTIQDQVYTVTEILYNSTTITVTAPPSTVTVYLPPTTTTATVTATPNITQTSTTQWTMPTIISDLSPFNITKLSGSQNLKIVNGIPANASASPTPVAISVSISPSSSDITFIEEHEYPEWTNDTSALQAFYPAGSVNPGQKPLGGAQFYSTPVDLDLAETKNVSLIYSVFFPVDFDFVLAGKLPGLYGGRSGCSGGDEALDCFSTRLMWRQNGKGELYLVRTIYPPLHTVSH